MLRWQEQDAITNKPVLFVTPGAIDFYYEAFRTLCLEFPECWHLCVQAEDRCRAEHFARLGRKLAAKTGSTPSWYKCDTGSTCNA